MKQKLLLTLFSLITSFISAQSFSEGQITYEITSPTTVEVDRVQSSAINVVIPANVTYNATTYTVTTIGEWAFSSCELLQSVDISNTVTTIKFGAFASCYALSSISIPNSVTSIEGSAFFFCNSLSSIVIPDSVTSIEETTFFGCTALNSIVFPSVVSIGKGAFWNCGFTSINIGNSVESIGDYAFAYCSSLAAVVIPDSVTLIGPGAFFSCPLTSVLIPNYVTSIGNEAFADCTSLTTVLIPNSVASIGDEAFSGCTALASITCNIEVPLLINSNVFTDVDKSACSLDVPVANIAAYLVADVWKDFFTTLGTDSFNTNNSAVFYPNPFSNSLYVDLNKSDKTELQVLDVNGKVVIAETLNEESNELDTSNLSSGMYFIKVSSENGNTVKKVIKN